MDDTNPDVAAHELTTMMRHSDEGFWPAVRQRLTGLEVNPAQAVVGGVDPDQSPIVIVVTPDERAFALFVEQTTDRGEYLIEPADELVDPDRRFPWSAEIHTGLVLLEEERPGSVDERSILRETIERLTGEMRDQADWDGLRGALLARGVDPSTSLLVDAREVIEIDRPPRRHLVIRARNQWIEVETLVPATGASQEVLEWRELDEPAARLKLGARVDTAHELARRER